ncbi:helix-turn-helix transcriptional regulator [Erythrobacter sp. SD-21]|uniref:helix-turn-helix transcriptional regulator n=1 Tax=Erythrobacter sp. SD-21 TaxID=161528 RepID=UPI000153F2BE|nr:helix-turn-helix transcriptional regulator [Erythrobacter sp. SD-21]EDL48337.1 hypothetical protein ED21_22513 [Erythrobacter sp. SD-21]
MGLSIELLERRCHDAATGAYAWDALLRDIGEWVGGSKGMMLGNGIVGPLRHSLDWNHDPEALALYNSHYNRFDPRARYSRLTPLHGAQLGQAYVRNESIAQTEYFEAINLGGDVKDSVHGIIANDAELGRRSLSIQRGFKEEFFNEREADRLAVILPTLERAMKDSIRVARSVAGHMSGDGYCYVVVDRARRAIFADSSTDDPFAEQGPLSLTGDLLASGNQSVDRAIEQAIDTALYERPVSLHLAGVKMEFGRVPQALAWLAHDDHCFLAIVAQQKQAETSARLFATAHDFSAREGDILAILLAEDDLRLAARQCGLSYETVRWHLKNMQTKCGVSRREAMLSAARKGRIG